MGEMGRLRVPAWEAGGMGFSGMAWLGGLWGLGCRAGGRWCPVQSIVSLFKTRITVSCKPLDMSWMADYAIGLILLGSAMSSCYFLLMSKNGKVAGFSWQICCLLTLD